MPHAPFGVRRALQQEQQWDDDQEGQADYEEDAVEGQGAGLAADVAVHDGERGRVCT